MEALARHPAEALFGAQNAHIMHAMRVAQRAVDQMIADGYTVNSVEVRDRNPVIWIATCARCAELGGAAHIVRTHTLGTRVTVMAVNIGGSQVQWVAP